MTAPAIGILGGTFDPVHFGHLRPAIDVLQQLKLDHIRLIPNNTPPHRPAPVATAQQRMLMLHLAVKNSEQFVVDDRELHRDGASYTVDTLRSLRGEFQQNPLYLLLGTDAFLGIASWHNWQQLLEFAHIVVMQRPDEILNLDSNLADWYHDHLAIESDVELLAGKIWPVDVTQLAISATEIRKQYAVGKSIQFLLPDSVIQVIEQLGLYKENCKDG